MLQICHIYQTKQNKSAWWSVGSAVWSHVYGGQSSQLPHGYWSPSHIMSAPASIRDVIMARVRTHPGLTMNPSSGSQSQSQHHSDCSHYHWPHHFQGGLLMTYARCSGASSSRTFNLHESFKITLMENCYFPGLCCQECQRSSRQSCLWSIHMV